jgi:glycosyltransferase involved in cell wall biosynthesis
LHVVQLLGSCEEGGLENHFIDLCNSLDKKGVSLTVIAHPMFMNRLSPSIHIHPVDFNAWRWDPFLISRIAKLIRKEKGDIVHAHAGKAVSILSSIRHIISGKKVATIHGLKKNLKPYLRMDGLIAVSKGVASHIPHDNINIIYNGVPDYFGPKYTKSSLPDELPKLNHDRLTIAAGRLVAVKGFDILINAWQKEMGQLWIIGDGPEKNKLSGLIYKNSLTNNVFLIGHRTDLRGIMNAADLLVFSSRREGFSLVLAEALLSSLPVVSTKVPGAKELIPPKYLCDTESVASLQKLLKKCTARPDMVKEDQAHLFEYAKENLTLDKMVDHTLTYYKHLLGTS